MNPTVRIVVAAVLIILGLFGRIFTPTYELETRGKIRKYVGILCFVVGALFALRALEDSPGKPSTWLEDLETAKAESQKTARPLIIDFSASFCKACKELEQKTFPAPEVEEKLQRFVLLRLDLTEERPELDDLQKELGVVGLPSLHFITAQGEHIKSETLSGFEPAEEFSKRLDRVLTGMGDTKPTLASRITEALQNGAWSVYALIFLAGVLASLSPCVYPLIPITLGVLSRGKSGALEGFLRSLVFVLGIATMYAVLGALAATSGGLLGSALQSPVVVVIVACVFLVMGASMVGVFEMQLPGNLSTKLSSVGRGRLKGSALSAYVGAFLMGSVAGIVAAPCVGPPLVAVLTFVASQGSLQSGLALLLTYALGLGLLFLFLGTFTGLVRKIPKSGNWMNVVKTLIGLAIIVLGGTYLNDVFGFIP